MSQVVATPTQTMTCIFLTWVTWCLKSFFNYWYKLWLHPTFSRKEWASNATPHNHVCHHCWGSLGTVMAFLDGTVISTDLKKPKKQRVAAAHNVWVSFFLFESWYQYAWSWHRISGVTQVNRTSVWTFESTDFLLVLCKCGNDKCSFGSGRPSTII